MQVTAAIQANSDRLNNKFTSKIQSDSSVAGVPVFSKSSYPDMMLADDSVREIWDNLQNGQDENLKFLFEELKEQEIFSSGPRK